MELQISVLIMDRVNILISGTKKMLFSWKKSRHNIQKGKKKKKELKTKMKRNFFLSFRIKRRRLFLWFW